MEEVGQFLAADAVKHGRIGDLVAVQVQYRQHCAIAHRIDELVGMPAGGQCAGFGFAVADHAGNDQVGIVEGCAVCVRKAVTKLAAFMNRPRYLRRDVARYAIGPGKLAKQSAQSFGIARDGRIVLGIGAFQISVGDDAGTAMAGADDVHHVQVMLANQPVQVDIQQVQAGGSAPVTEQARLDIGQRKRRGQQRIVLQVNLAD